MAASVGVIMSRIDFLQVHQPGLDEDPLCTPTEAWRCGLFVRVGAVEGLSGRSSLSWDGQIVGVHDILGERTYDVEPTDAGVRGWFRKDVLSILDPVSTITDTTLTEDVLDTLVLESIIGHLSADSHEVSESNYNDKEGEIACGEHFLTDSHVSVDAPVCFENVDKWTTVPAFLLS